MRIQRCANLTANRPQLTPSEIGSGRTKVAYGVLIACLVLLAGVPWFLRVQDPPLVSPSLYATPTAYALSAAFAATATKEAERRQPLRVTFSGVAPTELDVYRCPGERFRTGRSLQAGTPFDIYGWGLDAAGAVWFVTLEQGGVAREWVTADPLIEVSVDDYRIYFPEASICGD